MKQFTIIGAPASSICHGQDVANAPEALRNLGLGAVLAAKDGGDVDCSFGPLTKANHLNFLREDAIIEASMVLRRRIAHIMDRGEVPFLIGGCCAVLPGALAGACDATQNKGSMGLIYVDGHTDLYDDETSPTGEAADMPLATVLGRGPRSWMAALGESPLVRPENVAILGYRDHDETQSEHALSPADFGPGFASYEADQLRGNNAGEAAANVHAKLANTPGRFWLHFDVDVLDDAMFPATDYLMPDGLDWEETASLLRPFVRSQALSGLSLACYNPSRDTGASCGLRLVDMFKAICKT